MRNLVVRSRCVAPVGSQAAASDVRAGRRSAQFRALRKPRHLMLSTPSLRRVPMQRADRAPVHAASMGAVRDGSSHPPQTVGSVDNEQQTPLGARFRVTASRSRCSKVIHPRTIPAIRSKPPPHRDPTAIQSRAANVERSRLTSNRDRNTPHVTLLTRSGDFGCGSARPSRPARRHGLLILSTHVAIGPRSSLVARSTHLMLVTSYPDGFRSALNVR